jgi:hypothetical protein
MAQLFPKRLTGGWANAFNPEQATNRASFEHDQIVASKKELLKLMAEHPDARNLILSTWQAMFPADGWAQDLPAGNVK